MNKRIRKKHIPESVFILDIHGGEFNLEDRTYAYSDINALYKDIERIKAYAAMSGNYLLPDNMNTDSMYDEKRRWPIARYDIYKLNIGSSPMKDQAFMNSFNYAIDEYNEDYTREEEEEFEW